MKLCLLAAIASFTASSRSCCTGPCAPGAAGSEVQPFVHVPAGRTAITHLRIIDGTGATSIERTSPCCLTARRSRQSSERTYPFPMVTT